MTDLNRREFMRGAAGLALLAAGCGPGNRRPRNVVCILVDQLREDAAERYLSGVDALARQGVVFEDMRSAAPWTYPSVISLLSGLYPQQHGADGQVHSNLLSHFDPRVPLLQRRLKDAGYTTSAFITNPFLLGWNAFHLGFDTFVAGFIRSQGDERGDESVWKPRTTFSDSVNRAVRERFDAFPPRAPEFTYVHYIDVHGPWRGAPFPGEYAEAIRFVDSHIVELYHYFMRRYDGDLIFVVTADHGRALGDDLSVGEGRAWRKDKHSVHDYNLRIPFMILPSEFVTHPRRIAGPCSNVDFVPTILDWLGLPPPEQGPGISLLPAIRSGAPLPVERPIYARNSAFGFITDGVVQGDRKYVRYFDPDSRALVATRVFDLAQDPRETHPIADDLGKAREVVREAASTHGIQYEGVFQAVSGETESQLRALGYLGGK